MDRRRRPATLTLLAGAQLIACSSVSAAGDAGALDGAGCYADTDGLSGGAYVFDLSVDDTGFSKLILSSQNDAQVTLTLTNTGTRPHGFEVGCATTTAPAGCSSSACFPSNASIAPLAPGDSATITFVTPTPDGIIYPFRSSEPADRAVPGLSDGQWSLQ